MAAAMEDENNDLQTAITEENQGISFDIAPICN